MKTDGQTYANYIDNIIEDHRTKNLKSICSYLLQTSCKSIHGFTIYLLGYLNELLEFNLSQLNSFDKYNFMKADDVIFKLNISNEYQLDLVFFVYSIISDKVIRSQNYMLVGLFLIKSFNYFLSFLLIWSMINLNIYLEI